MHRRSRTSFHRLTAILICGAICVGLTPTQLSAQTSTQTAAQSVRVVVANANVRREPNTTSAILRSVSAGTVLEVIRRQGDWVLVRLPKDSSASAMDGYISAPLIEAIEVRAAAQAATSATRPAPPAASSGDRPTQPAAPVRPLTLKPDFEVAKQTWSYNMATAREDASNAKRIMLGGVGFTGLSFFVYKTGFVDYQGIAAIGLIGGVGVTAFGGFKYSKANQHVAQLSAEGKAKGFALLASPRGAGISYTFAF